MPSKLYKILDTEIKLLQLSHLDFAQSPTGSYTPTQITRGFSLAIFSHAAIESYLECWVEQLLSRAEKQLKKGKISHSLACLLSFSSSSSIPKEVPKHDIWTEPCWKAIACHRAVATRNNGIKTENICQLFIPLGVDLRLIDPLVFPDFDAFGSIRGEIAHKPQRIITSIETPYAILEKVGVIMKHLQALDGLLEKY